MAQINFGATLVRFQGMTLYAPSYDKPWVAVALDDSDEVNILHNNTRHQMQVPPGVAESTTALYATMRSEFATSDLEKTYDALDRELQDAIAKANIGSEAKVSLRKSSRQELDLLKSQARNKQGKARYRNQHDTAPTLHGRLLMMVDSVLKYSATPQLPDKQALKDLILNTMRNAHPEEGTTISQGNESIMFIFDK
jgi:hypothetical protein